MNQFQRFAQHLQNIADNPVCQLNRRNNGEILVRFRRRSQTVVTIYSGLNSKQLSGEVRSELLKYLPKLARPLGGSMDTVELSYSPTENRVWIVVKFSRLHPYTTSDIEEIRKWIVQLSVNTVGHSTPSALEQVPLYATKISATFTYSDN